MNTARLLSPEQVGKLFLERLPNGTSVVMWNFWQILSWIMLPIAFVSQVTGLAVVVDWLHQAYAALQPIQSLLVVIGDVVGGVIRWWRALTSPIRELLASLLPPSAYWMPDALMMTTLALPSLVRVARISGAVSSFSKRTDLASGRRLAEIIRTEEEQGLQAYVLDAQRLQAGRRAIRSSVALASFAGVLTLAGLVLVLFDGGRLG